MQIKRFEAADMGEALRLVKREFGEEAVILSAKEIRPGGILGPLRKKRVEITAAADDPAANARREAPFYDVLSQRLKATEAIDRVSLSVRPVVAAAADSPPQTAAHFAEPFYRRCTQRSRIALVGTAGTGKSSTAAKLARHCHVVEKLGVGLISLDRFGFAANTILESVARMMNLPFKLVYDAGDLQTALNDLAHVDVVLIDTPGMGRADVSMLQQVRHLLQQAEPDETHLVMNATVRGDIAGAAVETFRPAGVNRLLVTHMDECGDDGGPLALLHQARLPASFLTDGADMFDHLHEATADRFKTVCPPGRSPAVTLALDPVVADLRRRGPTQAVPATDESSPYVANRNSELFHHPDCKSVKRINLENVAAFTSMEQALRQGFKPCRTCCDGGIRQPSLEGAAVDRHARAI